MADFRKLFSVLAVVALMTGFAISANAQPALSCTGNAGVPPIVRAEGLTELTGDVVLNCTGGDPTKPFTANFQIFLNTNITSRLLTSGTGVSGSTTSEALILIDEPVTPVVNTNAFRGQKASGENSIVWLGVPFTPPGTNTRVIRITNVRANASQLLPPGSASQLIPPQIIMYISVSGSTAVPVNNPQQVVGYVQSGLSFDVRNCTNTGGGSTTLNQCTTENSDANSGNFGGTFTAPTSRFNLRFTENFATAFKQRIQTASGTIPAQDPSSPGTVYNSESGYVNTAALGAETGFATNATRLVAKFTNIPSTVKIFAALGNNAFTAGAGGGSSTLTAVLLSGVDANGGGGSVATSVTTGILCGPTGAVAPSLASIPVATDGTAVAVWEVTNSSTTASEVALFPIAIAYGARTVGLGTASVGGEFGPYYASPTGTTQSATQWVPRFVDSPITRTLFTISICQTNLLFTFVSNQSGFDTGIAISNTSADIFGTAAQAGTCDINYFGTGASGSAVAKTKETSQSVAAGSQLVFTLSSGGNLGVTGNPGFQGYIIAKCNFQWAHGFAFISDLGGQKVAEGYLALVMDAGTLVRDTKVNGEALNN